jgi:hypothetical protein
MADGPCVASLRVARTARNELGVRASRGRGQAGGPQRGNRETSPAGGGERGRPPRVENAHHRIEIVDLESPSHVRATDAELAWGSQRVRDGDRGPDGEERAVAARRRQRRAIPELDAERALGERVGEFTP